MTHPFASEHYQKMAPEARQLVRQWVNESQIDQAHLRGWSSSPVF